MNLRIFTTLSSLCIATAQANLVITEINSNGAPADFWELTNFGASPVDLSGFVWIDDAQSPSNPAALKIPAGTTILPDESIVFVTSGTEGEFRSAWNLDPSVKIILGGPNLGQNDAIYLYNSLASQVASLRYAANGFIRSNGTNAVGGHAGASAGGTAVQSLIYDPNFGPVNRRYTFASGGNFDTYTANVPSGAGVGSPGKIGEAGMNSLPTFTNAPRTFWRASFPLTTSPFRVVAVDTDAGQSVTLSVVSKPAWLTISAEGPGRYRLSGTPPTAGDFPFMIRATDNAPIPGVTEQTFTLTAFPTSSPILLNEYNAVAPDMFLRGGTASQDEDGVSPGPRDSHFGRVLGNGGQWVEFVVVGNGTAGSTTDMRGWTIEIHGSNGPRAIKLSQDPYWSNVIAGTILTFTATNSANGGLDTGIHRASALHNLGYVWTNIWAMDPLMVSQADSNVAEDLGIDSNDSQFVVRDKDGVVIYGPAGEGVASSDPTNAAALLGVNSREVVRLQQNPGPGIDPLFGTYNDADSGSSFGAPNAWGNGPTVQSFSTYVRPNSPPRFTSSPVTHAFGGYSYTVTTADPNGNTVTLSAGGLPDFLTLTPGPAGTATLAANRPLTLADAGEHTIRLVANDGGSVASTTPQTFVLNVFHTAPSVILNEFNAVSESNFLNGGTGSSVPPGAMDSHFGRVAGNGGRWFELVVVGDGGPSVVDMRGWAIEVGTSTGGAFVTSNTLRLSQDPYWASVPAGTILTFIDRDTARGGLDTGINRRNRLTTEGDAWTNVWMGDPALLDYSDPATNGYAIGEGIVEGIQVDNNDTQFILRNAAGEAVFGPVGEGVTLTGVSSTEVFELEDHPSPSISPLIAATPTRAGYDDGASGSTFGHPNRWQLGDGGPEVSQDFSPFTLPANPYATWAASFDLAGADAESAADPDGDGRSNITEYAFGGNPSKADGSPVPQQVARTADSVTWSYLRRGDDPAVSFIHQQSEDLAEWVNIPEDQVELATIPHPEFAGYQMVTVVVSASEAREFFRVTLAE
jgi:hypothetical protein